MGIASFVVNGITALAVLFQLTAVAPKTPPAPAYTSAPTFAWYSADMSEPDPHPVALAHNEDGW